MDSAHREVVGAGMGSGRRNNRYYIESKQGKTNASAVNMLEDQHIK